MNPVLLQSEVAGFPCRRGKVRDVYDLGDRLVIVATDRISAFDWVLPTGIPDKQTLTLVEKSATGSLSAREILPVRFSELEDPGEMAGAA